MDDIEPSPIEPDDHPEFDADATDAIDAIGFRAGRALRRPAPSDGLARIERASSRSHVARAAIAVCAGVAVVAIGAAVIGTGRSAVAPTSPIKVDPSVTELDLPSPTPTPTPPTESIATVPPATPTTATTPTTPTTSTTFAATTTASSTTGMPAVSGDVIAQLPTSSSGAALSDDGTVLGLLAEKAALQTFDVATAAPLATLPCPQPGEPLDAAWDGQHRAMLARASAMVDANPGAALMRTDDPIRPGCRLAFSLDGTRVAVSDPADDVTILFDARDGAELARINGTRPVFSPGGTMLVVGGAGATTVWDGATGRQLGTLDSDGVGPANVAATFSPDGAMIATLNVAAASESSPGDGTLIFWDAATLERLRSFGGVRSYSFGGPFGTQVVVARLQRPNCFCVEIIDRLSWQTLAEQNYFDSEIPTAVAFDPLGRFVYFVGIRSNLRLRPASLLGPGFGPEGIWMAAFNSDGTRLVLSGPAGTVMIDSSSP